jgi:hypothetical protein
MLSETMREAIADERNLLLDEPKTLSWTKVLEVLSDICMRLRVPFAALPSQLTELRTEALRRETHEPTHLFITLVVVRVFNDALDQN